MPHLRSLEALHLPGSWITIGSFDGVHLGHRALIERLVDSARSAGLASVVVTFFPHPVAVLRGVTGPLYLSSPEERADLLADLGVDCVLTMQFDTALASLTADEFMERLSSHLSMRGLVVGHDFALGRGRQGNVAALEAIGSRLGYQVKKLAPIENGDQAISSSRIRELLEKSEVRQAAQLLGRPYRVTGQVVHGDGRGKTIGIPTANLSCWPLKLLPGRGVYATRAWLDGRPIQSVTNIGLRPTFENQTPGLQVEAHLLDHTGDVYGRELQLDFIEFIRPEQRFSGVTALIEQIHRDIQTAREVFGNAQ